MKIESQDVVRVSDDHAPASVRLERASQEVAALRAEVAADASLSRRLALVKGWQSARLARTHEDLLTHPRYQLAARFFLDDLYGEHNIGPRDAELARVIPTLVRFLPESALATIADAIELDALSEILDAGLARALPGEIEALDDPQYAQAYRASSVSGARQAQIDLVRAIGHSLDRLVRQPLLGGLLRSMGMPARRAGLGHLHEFLTRGFQAFKAMNGATEFLQIILSREERLMLAIEAGRDEQLAEFARIGLE